MLTFPFLTQCSAFTQTWDGYTETMERPPVVTVTRSGLPSKDKPGLTLLSINRTGRVQRGTAVPQYLPLLAAEQLSLFLLFGLHLNHGGRQRAAASCRAQTVGVVQLALAAGLLRNKTPHLLQFNSRTEKIHTKF